MKNAAEVAAWLAEIGPHLYCCGHVHAAWAFVPREPPRPALPERRRPLAPRPDRPAPPASSRSCSTTRRDRDPSRLGRRRLDDPPPVPGPQLFPHPQPLAQTGLKRSLGIPHAVLKVLCSLPRGDGGSGSVRRSNLLIFRVITQLMAFVH